MKANPFARIPLLLLVAAACSSDPTSNVQPGDRDPELPAEQLRAFTATELSAASSNNSFGIALFQRVAAAESGANIIVSPLSASMALGMTLNGAAGSTYDAMRDVLGFSGSDEAAINDAYRGLIAQLHARGKTTEFHLANSIWYRSGFEVRQPFLDAAASKFAARVSSLDFSSPDAAKTISQWAEDQTGGRIKNLVDEVNPVDMMFLINAVYFKAPWDEPFETRATSSRSFKRANGSAVDVPMMSNTGQYRALENSEVQAVEMLYEDTTFSMVLVAPAGAGSLAQMTSSLTPAKWSAWMSTLKPVRIDLEMPKFRFEYDVTMNDALKAQGMGVAFDPSNANFDRIPMQTVDDLHISKVRQKAFIDVHERGTEAAAATSVTVSVTSLPPTIRFDRPFLFAIRERSSGTILFVGRVGDPTQ